MTYWRKTAHIMMARKQKEKELGRRSARSHLAYSNKAYFLKAHSTDVYSTLESTHFPNSQLEHMSLLGNILDYTITHSEKVSQRAT